MRVKSWGVALAALALPLAAQAAERIQSGTFNGASWTAQSRIVGQTSTATRVGGGNPLYFAAQPKYSGVVALIMDYGAGGRFICSGTLMNDRRSVVSAAHCVTDANLNKPISTTAYFYGGNNPDTVVPFNALSTAAGVANIFVNPDYTGEVIDQNDIAVLRLADFAPAFATSFDLYDGGDLTGQKFNVAGYGGRSDGGGAIGANLGTGRLRQGINTFDFRLGDDDFGGTFDGGANGFFGTADTRYSYLSDFDNGLATNDASCQLATAGFGLAASSKYCDSDFTSVREVSVAGGDSGGPQFINGQLAAVTSYGLSFGTGFGDIDDDLNSTWGEFNGFVPTFIHREFIRNAVPEPATWLQMIFGFGVIGGLARRRKDTVSALV